MALIECPDCGRKISDRAAVCPDCSCPVREVLAERRAEEELKESIKTRKRHKREVDCPRCEAKGWHPYGEKDLIQWCIPCEATGRVVLCEDAGGFVAVAPYAIDRWLAGEIHAGRSGVVFAIGKTEPKDPRFKPHKRMPVEPGEIPWVTDPEKKD
jgi:hypothetical protein